MFKAKVIKLFAFSLYVDVIYNATTTKRVEDKGNYVPLEVIKYSK